MNFSVRGNIVDIPSKNIFYGKVFIENGKINFIEKIGTINYQVETYILPGFIDAHIHIESSMLVPSEFARLAVVHGTVATVSDPHEIANVCGLAGVDFMIQNGNTVPFKFYFGAPSCVPATAFETSGACMNADEVDKLLARNEIGYLSEMMNFPGVLNNDEEVMKKINSAKNYKKPVDGHAPGLRGEIAKKYFDAGITTDHECFSKEEALDKINLGINILIREGSAAKNFDTLIELLNDHPEKIMFCSDDKHPDSLVEGHINDLCKRAVAKNINLFNVLKAACLNPVAHYNLDVGTLKQGDPADFIIVEDLKNFKVLKTYINGELVAEDGASKIMASKPEIINHFKCTQKNKTDFEFLVTDLSSDARIIEALDGQLITNMLPLEPKFAGDKIVSDINNDILKMVVVNRYNNSPVSKALVKNFGLQKGAIASSVAHDSHNIIAVGTDDEDIYKAVNLIISHRGGLSCVSNEAEIILPLPVAGLMSDQDGYKVAEKYTELDKAAKSLGSKLSAPFMTLSFMALLVIPHLKLSDRGLFDGDKFELIK